jgi:DNA-binding transcriptional regulator LsrR (DeoR family)
VQSVDRATPADETRQLMALVARMYYLDDLDQQQIAGVVGA